MDNVQQPIKNSTDRLSDSRLSERRRSLTTKQHEMNVALFVSEFSSQPADHIRARSINPQRTLVPRPSSSNLETPQSAVHLNQIQAIRFADPSQLAHEFELMNLRGDSRSKMRKLYQPVAG